MFAKIVRTPIQTTSFVQDPNPNHLHLQFATIFALFGIVSAGVLPAAYVAPYAFSHNEHVVNHAIAAPVAQAVISSPYVAAPAAYSAYPATYSAFPAAYSAYPGAYSAASLVL